MQQSEPDPLRAEVERAIRDALGVGKRGGPPFADWEQIVQQTADVALALVEKERALREAAETERDDFRAQAEAQSDRNETIQRHLEDHRESASAWAQRSTVYFKRAEAAEKALREQRERWGHIAGCRCGQHVELCYHQTAGDGCPMRDPRCAPGGER